jgi:hypothetical protein
MDVDARAGALGSAGLSWRRGGWLWLGPVGTLAPTGTRQRGQSGNRRAGALPDTRGRRAGAAGRSGSAPCGEPDGKAVPGTDQRGVETEHMDQPEPGCPQFRPGWPGNEPGQRVARP